MKTRMNLSELKPEAIFNTWDCFGFAVICQSEGKTFVQSLQTGSRFWMPDHVVTVKPRSEDVAAKILNYADTCKRMVQL